MDRRYHYQGENIYHADLVSYIKRSHENGKTELHVQDQILTIRHSFNHEHGVAKCETIKGSTPGWIIVQTCAATQTIVD